MGFGSLSLKHFERNGSAASENNDSINESVIEKVQKPEEVLQMKGG